MSEMNNNYGPVVSASTLLGTAFVVLKLCGVINWSWWWVTCPFWAGLAILLAIGGICLAGFLAVTITGAIATAIKKRKQKK